MNKTTVRWDKSGNEKLIEAVNKYWRGEKNLEPFEIGLLSRYLEEWIGQGRDYPKKEEHIIQAREVESFDAIKYLTNQIMNWRMESPW